MSSNDCSKIRRILLAASAALICCGVSRGDLSIIFAKATRVCLECIGLG